MVKNLPIKDKQIIKQIKAAYKKTRNTRDLLLFLLVLNTGLNISSVLKLNVKDVKNKAGMRLRGGVFYYFTPEIRKLIEKAVENRAKDEPLFISRFNKRLERFRAHFVFREVCDSLSLDEYSISSLRRTFGYHHYQKYKDLFFLQWYFKHKTPEETMRYIDIKEDISERFKAGVKL